MKKLTAKDLLREVRSIKKQASLEGSIAEAVLNNLELGQMQKNSMYKNLEDILKELGKTGYPLEGLEDILIDEDFDLLYNQQVALGKLLRMMGLATGTRPKTLG